MSDRPKDPAHELIELEIEATAPAVNAAIGEAARVYTARLEGRIPAEEIEAIGRVVDFMATEAARDAIRAQHRPNPDLLPISRGLDRIKYGIARLQARIEAERPRP